MCVIFLSDKQEKEVLPVSDILRRRVRMFVRPAGFVLFFLLCAAGPLCAPASAAGPEAGETEAVQTAVETFLRSFSEKALLYEERDLYSGTAASPGTSISPEEESQVFPLSQGDMTLADMRENIAFLEKKADYLSGMRQMQGIYRRDLELAYTYRTLEIEDTVCCTEVTETSRFYYTDSAVPSVNESTYLVDLIKLEGRWLVAFATDGSGFDQRYGSQGSSFDADAALEELEKSLAEENCRVISVGTDSGGQGSIPYDGASAAAYAYTYSRRQSGQSREDFYDPLFAHFDSQGGDCMNFASQCMWAGFGGSETGQSAGNRALPMDASGSNRWYGQTAGGRSAANSWVSCRGFRNYLTGTPDASGTGGSNGGGDAGMYATILEAAAGSPLAGVSPEELVGAAAHVDGSGGAYSHAIVITAAAGIRRDQIWFCGHTRDVSHIKLGDCYLGAMKVYIPRYLRTGSSGGRWLRPIRTQPVPAGGNGWLGIQSGSVRERLWLTVTGPDGGTVEAGSAENAAVCWADFTFPQAGRYRVDCYAQDAGGSVSTAVYYVLCFEPEVVPEEVLPEELPPEEEGLEVFFPEDGAPLPEDGTGAEPVPEEPPEME